MKEKIKNLNNKKIVIISMCAFVIVLLLGLTYAYWSRTFSQTGENTSTYDCFDISFSENTDGITMENGYPISDEEGLKTDAYEVTITNTCKTAATYNVILNKLNTSTLDDSHVKIAVDSDIKLLSETETTTSTISNASEARIINTGILAGKDSKKVSIRSWMDEATTKEEGSNKIFNYKTTIDTITANNSNLLAAKVLKENVQTNITWEAERDKGVFTVSGEKTLNGNSTYFYRGNVKNNYVKFGKYKENYTLGVNGPDSDIVNIFPTLENAEKGCEYYYDYNYETKEDCIVDINSNMDTVNEAMIWRIVRINEDGSIRLVLNKGLNNNYQFLYTYRDSDGYYISDSDYLISYAKTNLEDWYNIHLKDSDKIINSVYCNNITKADEEPSDVNTTFNCQRKINAKIGLLTADEVYYAGAGWGGKYSNYLVNGNNTWLMSSNENSNPVTYYFTEGFPYSDVYLDYLGVYGLRPVINLKSDTLIVSGDGTKNNPYVIE